MTLDAKALEAAAEVYAGQDCYELPPTPSDIEGTAEDLRDPIQAYLDAADLVPRSDTYQQPSDGWVCFHCGERFTTPGAASDHFGARPGNKLACKIKAGDERGLVMGLRKAQNERDEARREADDYLHELVDERARSDDAFKQQAALREALEEAKDTIKAWHDMPISGKKIHPKIWDTYAKHSPEMKRINATLADTAEAGARWVRSFLSSFVDAILHGDPEHRGWLREAGENFAVGKSVPPPRGSGFAAAPKAGEPAGD